MTCNRTLLIVGLASIVAGGLLLSAEASKPKIPTFPAPDFTKAKPWPVVRAVDGDTIVVKVDYGLVKVRLIGVDTPETVHPTKTVEYYGKEASRFTNNLLKGENVHLVTDPQQGAKDRYGRTLAYVYRAPDGLFVNAEIIRQGYGHAYPKYPFKYMEKFKGLERFAREAKKGLWDPTQKIVETLKPVKTKPPVPPVKPPEPAPIVKPKPQPRPGPGDVIVYVTRTGKKYHQGSCRYLRRSKIPMKLIDAKARYGPCSVCGPP